jgi:hypothetical protein
VKRLIVIWFIILMAIVGCSGNNQPEPDETTIDPAAILSNAAELMKKASTFSLEVVIEGAPFNFSIDLGEGTINVGFLRAIGQFINPSEIQARVNVRAGGNIELSIYASNEDQWFRAPLVGWVNQDFATGFNPARIIREGGGFEAAVGALRDLTYLGLTGINGITSYHFKGEAAGEKLTDLLVGLIEIAGDVPVEVFVDQETGYPVRLIIETTPAPDDTHEESTNWIVDIFDINKPDSIDRPPEQAAS